MPAIKRTTESQALPPAPSADGVPAIVAAGGAVAKGAESETAAEATTSPVTASEGDTAAAGPARDG